MKKIHLLFGLMSGLMIYTLPLLSQNTDIKKNLFTFQVGPSWYIGNFMGITNYSDQYQNNLQNGISWNATYYYLGRRSPSKPYKLAPGLIYQGGRYKNRHEEGSDKILMHYIAPQLALYLFKHRYNLSLAVGAGYQLYSDKSTVFGKAREVSMNKFAYNLVAAGEYVLSPQWGVSARLDWIKSRSDNYSVDYHGIKWSVEDPQINKGKEHFSQLSLLIGLNYHF